MLILQVTAVHTPTAGSENQNRASGRIVRFWHSDYFFSWIMCHWGILGPGKDDGGFAGKWHCNLPSAEVTVLSWTGRGQERGYDDQAKVESLERLLQWVWPIVLANATRPVDRLEVTFSCAVFHTHRRSSTEPTGAKTNAHLKLRSRTRGLAQGSNAQRCYFRSIRSPGLRLRAFGELLAVHHH